jgi:hypothetical protein
VLHQNLELFDAYQRQRAASNEAIEAPYLHAGRQGAHRRRAAARLCTAPGYLDTRES